MLNDWDLFMNLLEGIVLGGLLFSLPAYLIGYCRGLDTYEAWLFDNSEEV